MMMIKAVHLQVTKVLKLNARAENNRLNEIPCLVDEVILSTVMVNYWPGMN